MAWVSLPFFYHLCENAHQRWPGNTPLKNRNLHMYGLELSSLIPENCTHGNQAGLGPSVTLDFSCRLILKKPWCGPSALSWEQGVPLPCCLSNTWKGPRGKEMVDLNAKGASGFLNPSCPFPLITFFHPCLGKLHICEVTGSICVWMQVCFEVNYVDCHFLFCRATSLCNAQ